MNFCGRPGGGEHQERDQHHEVLDAVAVGRSGGSSGVPWSGRLSTRARARARRRARGCLQVCSCVIRPSPDVAPGLAASPVEVGAHEEEHAADDARDQDVVADAGPVDERVAVACRHVVAEPGVGEARWRRRGGTCGRCGAGSPSPAGPSSGPTCSRCRGCRGSRSRRACSSAGRGGGAGRASRSSRGSRPRTCAGPASRAGTSPSSCRRCGSRRRSAATAGGTARSAGRGCRGRRGSRCRSARPGCR